MTVKLAKSQTLLIKDFAGAAATHAVTMKAWRAHMARVKEDEKSGVTGLAKHWPMARPTAHPLIEAAVNENGEVAYELVDDGPSADQVLRQKKNHLLALVSNAEDAAIQAISPPGKRRLEQIREQDIRDADSRVAAEQMLPTGFLAAAASAIGVGKAKVDVDAEIVARRNPDDAKFLEKQAMRRRQIEAVSRLAAQAHADIEDLTLETIDAWQVPTFPTTCQRASPSSPDIHKII